MINELLKLEKEHKAAAARAADSRNYTRLAKEACELVRVYKAILASGMVAEETYPRWEKLLARWQEILAHATNSASKAPAARTQPAPVPPPAASSSAPSAAPVQPPRQSAPVKHTLKLADVKGLADAKQVVMDALVNPVRYPEIYEKLKLKTGKGLLLYGPPGTGKTMFARAVAGEMGIPFIYKKVSELKDKYVGESEKSVARLFEEAAQHKKCLIFLDECEGILRKRGNQKICLVEAFLAELDGFATNRDSQVFTLLATNRPWLIDSAVMRSGRISTAVHVGLPDEEARRFIIEGALAGLPLAPDVDIDEMVRRTEGYSGAELAHSDGGGVCDEMTRFAQRRWEKSRRERNLPPDDPAWHDTSDVMIFQEDFERALKKIVPVSVSDPEIIRRNREFSMGRGAASSADDDGE